MIVEFTATAAAELEGIGDYISRDNPARALSFVQELSRACLDLADMPQAWPVVPRYAQHGIRRRVQGRYLIFYRISGERITVLHILNGAMDVEAILFPDG
ncbi:MAG: type II toxin-antitoxin system RelE/ParE family toxin [Maritimibacter sp.]|nr:type II toxin-antitoxin system RelE/ParE family toxin [Maritimibacter sp.]MCB1356446.1 type II toxin-antitoxin system RelE/ParE family toxin [Maritimibacter sp.]